MSRKIKLIWDFRGEDAMGTAAHQAIHLKEFALREKLDFEATGSTEINPFHAIAFLICNEDLMKTYRDALLPHRAELA